MEQIEEEMTIEENSGFLIWKGHCVGVQAKTKEGVAFKIKFRVKLAYLQRTNGGAQISKPKNKNKKQKKDALNDSECEEEEDQDEEEASEEEEETEKDDLEELFGGLEEEEEKLEGKKEPASGKKRKYEEVLKTQVYTRKQEKPVAKNAKEKPPTDAEFVVSGFECNHIKSPVLSVTIKVARQKKSLDPVYELVEILDISRPPKLTVKWLRERARKSLMFDACSLPKRRNPLLSQVFGELGDDTHEVKDSKEVYRLLLKNFHEDVQPFFFNALRTQASFELAKKIGWSIPSLMSDQEVDSLPTLSNEGTHKLLRAVLFERTGKHCDAVLDKRGIEYFASKGREVVSAIAGASQIYKRLQFDANVRHHSCMKSKVGEGKYDVPPSVLDQLEELPRFVTVDVETDDKLTIKLKSIHDEEQEFAKAFAEVPETRFVDSQCNINHHTTNRYLERMFEFETETESMVWLTSFRRIALLKPMLSSTTHLFDFSEAFSFSSLDTVMPTSVRLTEMFKHVKKTCSVVIEDVHTLSMPKLTFVLQVISKLWKPLRIKHLILCGNRFCFPEAPGNPFTDLVNTFHDPLRLTTLHEVGDQRQPARFFEEAPQLVEYLDKCKIASTFEIVVANEPRLEKLKTLVRHSKHAIAFQLYSRMSYSRGTCPMMVLDLSEHDQVTMTQLRKALSIAPMTLSNLFVIGTPLEFEKVYNDFSKKNGNFRFTDLSSSLLNKRRDYETRSNEQKQ